MDEQKKIDAVDRFLEEQQKLTAVERFSEMHDKGKIPQAAKYYKTLLPGEPPRPGQQYAFEVDLDRCSGCKACITGCHNRNGLDEGEMWRNVGLIHGENRFIPVTPLKSSELLLGTLVTDVEKEKRYVPPSERQSNVQTNQENSRVSKFYFQQHITAACHHCLDPACLTGCPVKAYEKDPQTGIVRHLDDQCIGCQYCIYKCPYEAPQYSKARGIVRKCDMCTERLKEGEAPACVQSCPNEAIRITVVEAAQAKMDADKNFKIPFMPDPRYTQPATVYKSSRPIPDTVLPADYGILHPQPPEYPLVFMLVLTQTSVGINLLSSWLNVGGLFNQIQSLASLIAGAVGLGVATLHLGRPRYAFRAFLGFRTSWLSREAVFFGIFINLALAAAFIDWPPLKIAAAAFGLVALFSSGMIYFDTPRPGWNNVGTPLKFFLTAAMLGIAETLLAAHWFSDIVDAGFFSSLLLVVVFVKASLEAFGLLFFRESAKLMARHLKTAASLRWLALIAGTYFISTHSSLHGRWEQTAAGFLLLIAGECWERHLFFRAVIPPKMPGVLKQ